MAGRCLAKRSLVPNDLYGVLHASELKWWGAHGFYRGACDAATVRGEASTGGSLRDMTVFREKLRMMAAPDAVTP